MPGVTLEIQLFLLQQYWVEDDPMQARIVVIAIAALLAFVFVYRLIRRGGKSPVGSGGSYASAKSYNTFTLRRAAAPYGLDGEQVKLLDYVFRNGNVNDPVRIMGDSSALDRHFKRAFRNIDMDSRDEARTQQNLSRLFVLRNAIEAAPIEDESSHPVENSQAIIRYGKDNYNVKIYSTQGRSIITELPKNNIGTTLKISNGTNVNLAYLSKSNNSYSLPCSYVGIEKTEYGPGFKMNSSGRAKTLTKRQTRRRRIDLRCEFYLVTLVESGKGRNKTSKLIVSPKKFTGTIRDISAGGCSIKTPVPVQAGSRLKINCNLGNGEQATVLGQVIRSNRSATMTVIHVKFIKVPMRAYNSINTLVFGYGE
jgi:hypothetical protein